MGSKDRETGQLISTQQTAISINKATSLLIADRANLAARGMVAISKSAYERACEYLEQENWEEAIYWLRIAANQGKADAQYELGDMYYEGLGVTQSYSEAAIWYSKAAVQGHPAAQILIGLLNYKGRGIPQNYMEAAMWFRKAAEQGHMSAQYFIGRMYYKGLGVPQDYIEAATWFRKSAEQGLMNAQYLIGRMYYKDLGIPQDYMEAAMWFRKAAEQGLMNAQYLIGRMYYKDLGIPQDYMEAAMWFRKAAEQGHSKAQEELGDMYASGIGVPKNLTEADSWYQKAVKNKAENQYELGLRYHNEPSTQKDYITATKHFMEAAGLGYLGAPARLLGMNDDGAPKDEETAAWFRQGAEQGIAYVQYCLGRMYECGWIVNRDPVLAYMLFQIATFNEDNIPRFFFNLLADTLSRTAKTLSSSQLQEAQALAAQWAPGTALPLTSKTGLG